MPNLEGRLPTLDATRIPVSRSNGQKSGLEAGGGIPCRSNPAATLLGTIVRSCATSDPVSTRMSERLWTGKPSR